MKRSETTFFLLALSLFLLALLAWGWLRAHPSHSEAPSPPVSGESPAEQSAHARALEVLSKLSDWEKICQLFIVSPESLSGVSPTTEFGQQAQSGLERYPVGGLIFFAENLLSPEQTKEMIHTAQEASPYGLFIGTDEEGGTVSRVGKKLGATKLEPMFSYRNQGSDKARANAITLANELNSFGFNTDFAPVADVRSNPQNEVIGSRAYSDDPQQAGELVAAAVAGFHEGAVICALKHFPGHGDTSEDSHTGAAHVNKTKDELLQCELIPFSKGIEAGADMVMVGHLTVSALDDTYPASLSRPILTNLLREELGFDGIIITDGLKMAGIADLYSPAEIAVRFIEAGGDVLLDPSDLEASANALRAAVEDGSISRTRLDESVLRVLTLKARYGIL